MTRGMQMSRVTISMQRAYSCKATGHASEAARIGVCAAAEAVPADAVNGVSDLWLGEIEISTQKSTSWAAGPS